MDTLAAVDSLVEIGFGAVHTARFELEEPVSVAGWHCRMGSQRGRLVLAEKLGKRQQAGSGSQLSLLADVLAPGPQVSSMLT